MASELTIPFYTPADALKVPGHGHKHFAGTAIGIKGAPFLPDRLGDLSSVGFDAAFPTGETPITGVLRKVSPHHGRSYEFANGEKILWADEFGNVFTTLNTKGNNLTNPVLIPDATGDLTFGVNGMQTNAGIQRQLKASALMRSAGIETDAITHVIEPLSLPMNGETVSVEDFKNALKKDVSIVLDQTNMGDIVLGKRLADISFFTVVRATQVNERLLDYAEMTDVERKTAIKNAFFYTNLYESTQKKQNPDHEARHFDINNPEDIESYLHTYLPEKIGRNYAKLHKLGLTHTFSSAHNVNLAGAIVDLDSIKGFPLGDPEKLTADGGVPDLLNFINNMKYLWDSKQFVSDPQKFTNNVIDSYIRESMVEPMFIYTAASNIASVIEEGSQSHRDFFRYALEQTPIAAIDISTVLEAVNKAATHTDEGVELTPQQKYAIFDEIVWSLVTTNVDKVTRKNCHLLKMKPYDDLREVFNEFVSAKTQLIIDSEIELVRESLGEDADKEDETDNSPTRQAYRDAFVQVARDLGWEKDIKSRAFDISQNLPFESDIDQPLLNYYLDLFTQQTGIRLPWQLTTDELASEFYAHELKLAQNLQELVDKDKTTLPSEYGKNELGATIQQMLIYVKYFKDPFPEDRFNDFVFTRATAWMEELGFKQAILDATDDAEDADSIFNWFFQSLYERTLATPEGFNTELNSNTQSNLAKFEAVGK